MELQDYLYYHFCSQKVNTCYNRSLIWNLKYEIVIEHICLNVSFLEHFLRIGIILECSTYSVNPPCHRLGLACGAVLFVQCGSLQVQEPGSRGVIAELVLPEPQLSLLPLNLAHGVILVCGAAPWPDLAWEVMLDCTCGLTLYS